MRSFTGRKLEKVLGFYKSSWLTSNQAHQDGVPWTCKDKRTGWSGEDDEVSAAQIKRKKKSINSLKICEVERLLRRNNITAVHIKCMFKWIETHSELNIRLSHLCLNEKERTWLYRLCSTGEGHGDVLAELRDLSFSSGSSTELILTFRAERRALRLCTGLDGAWGNTKIFFLSSHYRFL